MVMLTMEISKKLKQETTDETWSWLETQDNKWKEIYYEKLSDLNKKDLTEEERSNQELKKKLKNTKFAYGYYRLRLFPLRRLDITTLPPNAIYKLAEALIKEPWKTQSVDFKSLNEASDKTIALYMDVYENYNAEINDFRNSIETIKKYGDNYALEKPSTMIAASYELAKLHSMLRTQLKYTDKSIRALSEMEWLRKEFSQKIRLIDMYIEIFLNLENQDYVFSVYNSKNYKTDDVRIDINRIMFYNTRLALAIDESGIEKLAVDYQVYLSTNGKNEKKVKAAKKKKNLSEEEIVKEKRMAQALKVSAAKVGLTCEELRDSIDRFTKMLEDKPIFPHEYYQSLYGKDTPGKRSLLDRDITNMNVVRPELYQKYNKMRVSNATITDGEKVTQYKKFAELLVNKLGEPGVKKYTNSSLYDLVMTIRSFDRKEYERFTENLPELSYKERNALRGFYRAKIEDSGCYVETKREEFLDGNLLVIRGREITNPIREKIIDYMEKQKQPLYQPIYMAIARAWLDGQIEIDGIKPEDAPIYQGDK